MAPVLRRTISPLNDTWPIHGKLQAHLAREYHRKMATALLIHKLQSSPYKKELSSFSHGKPLITTVEMSAYWSSEWVQLTTSYPSLRVANLQAEKCYSKRYIIDVYKKKRNSIRNNLQIFCNRFVRREFQATNWYH